MAIISNRFEQTYTQGGGAGGGTGYKDEEKDMIFDSEEDVLKRFEELEREYQEYLKSKEEKYDLDKLFPKDSGLKEIEYTPVSDEDIESAAKAQTNYNKKQELDKVEAKYIAAQEALKDGKKEADNNLKKSYENLNKLYNELRQNVQDDVLRRGLARSSIATSSINDLNREHLDKTSEQEVAYRQVVDDIDGKIAKLEIDKEGAIIDLDIKYAIELDDEINRLKGERDKTVSEYEKYNNSIREKQEKFEEDRQDKIADFLRDKALEKTEKEKEQLALEKKYGYTGEKLVNYSKRYDAAYEYYSSLSPDIALAALKASPNMRYYLGNFYNDLVSVLSGNTK